MKTKGNNENKNNKPAHTSRVERRELIASLSALSRIREIRYIRNLEHNRMIVDVDDLGCWIYYANTGTCFKACSVSDGDRLHAVLSDEGVHHTYRGSMKVTFAVA